MKTIEAALGSRSPIATVPLHDQDLPAPKNIGQSVVKGRVFVLTDSICASACLSFIDDIRLILGVIHVGQPTSADAAFMQTGDSVALSDDSVNFDFPIVRILNRTRGHNLPVQPRHVFDGDIYNQQSVEGWIEDVAAHN